MGRGILAKGGEEGRSCDKMDVGGRDLQRVLQEVMQCFDTGGTCAEVRIDVDVTEHSE